MGDQGRTGESKGHCRGPGRGADGVDVPQGLRSLWRLAEGGLWGRRGAQPVVFTVRGWKRCSRSSRFPSHAATCRPLTLHPRPPHSPWLSKQDMVSRSGLRVGVKTRCCFPGPAKRLTQACAEQDGWRVAQSQGATVPGDQHGGTFPLGPAHAHQCPAGPGPPRCP